MHGLTKPNGYIEGIRIEEGKPRQCDECGELTNHYQHDFSNCGCFFSITKCKKCSDKEERLEEFMNKHENESRTVCPWCEYEYEGYEDSYEENWNEEVECVSCGKTFLRNTEVKYSYTTWKPEGMFEVEE